MIANTKVATPATQPIVCVDGSDVHLERCQSRHLTATAVRLLGVLTQHRDWAN